MLQCTIADLDVPWIQIDENTYIIDSKHIRDFEKEYNIVLTDKTED